MSRAITTFDDDDDFRDDLDGIEDIQPTENRLPTRGKNGPRKGAAQANSFWLGRLLENGDPQPNCIVRNVQDFGFASPRLNYIEVSESISIEELIYRWGVPRERLISWRQEQKWDEQKQEYWKQQSVKMWEASVEQINEIRGRTLQSVLNGFSQLREMALQIARNGEKTRIVNGAPVQVPFEPRDVQSLIKSYDIAARGELAALGLNMIVKESSDNKLGDESVSPVEQMIFNYPANESEEKRLMALPMSSVLEAEVVEEVDEDEV